MLLLLSACSGRSQPKAPLVPLAATSSSAEAAYDAKNWAECAVQWISVAERGGGEQKYGAYYDAACCYALDGRADAAIAALEAAFEAGYWDAPHLLGDEDLKSLRAHAKWSAIAARAKSTFDEFEKSLHDAPLRRELLALAEKDQKARVAVKGPEDKAAIEATMAIDRETTARMKEVIAKHGWPGKSVVASDGANAAWLLVQHADADVEFQKQCLAMMEPLVKSGEVSGKDFAFLWDRVAVNEGRPQRFGTQFDGDDPAPIEDAANVDARRKAMGLSPLAEYKEQLKSQK